MTPVGISTSARKRWLLGVIGPFPSTSLDKRFTLLILLMIITRPSVTVNHHYINISLISIYSIRQENRPRVSLTHPYFLEIYLRISTATAATIINPLMMSCQ
jgi:hypothetical protein